MVSSGRTVGVIVGSVLVLVAASVAVVLLAGPRAPQTFPSDAPEAALQAYLKAWEARDDRAAYEAFSEDARRTTPFGRFQRSAQQWRAAQSPGLSRAVFFDRSDVRSERATIHLIVEERYGDGPWDGGYESTRDIDMVREDGAWRIAVPLVWLEPAEFWAY